MTLNEFRQAARDCGAEECNILDTTMHYCRVYFKDLKDAIAFSDLMSELEKNVLFLVGYDNEICLHYVQYA